MDDVIDNPFQNDLLTNSVTDTDTEDEYTGPTGDPREKMTVGEDGHFYNEDGERVFYYAPPFEAPREDTPHGWETAGIGRDPGGYYTEAEIKDYWNNHMGTFRDQHPHMDWDTYWEYLNERQGYIESGELADPTGYRNDALNNNRNPCAGLTGRAEEVCRAQTDRDIQQEQLTSMTDWLAGDLNASLAEKYGIQSKYVNSDGDEYLWNGSSYVRYYKAPGTDWGRFAASIMGAAFGAAIAPGITGMFGATSGTSAGIANGVVGSVIGQGLTTGKVDPGSVAIAGLLGGMNAFIDDLIVGGELIDEAGNFTKLADNTIWDLSHTLGLSYEETAEIIRGVMTGVITGDDLEGIVTGAVGAWGGTKLEDYIMGVLGDSDIDVANWFREGDTSISPEAIAGLARDGWDALIAGGMSETDAFMALYDYFDNGGSLDFMLPGMIDLAGLASGAFGDLDICERMPLLCDIELPECPEMLKDSEGNCLGTLPDIDIECPEGWDVDEDGVCIEPPNLCGEGYSWDMDLGECVPDVDINLPPIECPEGFQWDETASECIQIPNPCGEGMIWDADLGQCVDVELPPIECPEGFKWDETRNECIQIPEIPIECPEGFRWDDTRGECIQIPPIECPEGFEMGPDGECLEIEIPIECPEGFRWDDLRGECIQIPEIPIECPEGFQWDDTRKECIQIPDIPIECPEGFRNENGKCVEIDIKCPEGFKNEDGECVKIKGPDIECPEGFKDENGECIKIDGPSLPRGMLSGGSFAPKWGELFAYTTLTPYQQKALAPQVNYIQQAKGMLDV